MKKQKYIDERAALIALVRQDETERVKRQCGEQTK